MNEENNTQDPQMNQIEEITTISQLSQLLVAWYDNQIAILDQLKDVPAGTQVQVGDKEANETYVLEGDVLTGYLLGLNLALSNIGSLPFIMMDEVGDGDVPTEAAEVEAPAEVVVAH